MIPLSQGVGRLAGLIYRKTGGAAPVGQVSRPALSSTRQLKFQASPATGRAGPFKRETWSSGSSGAGLQTCPFLNPPKLSFQVKRDEPSRLAAPRGKPKI